MANLNKDIAIKVLELVGGKENINNAWNCVTRLRFNLKDKNKVKIDEIKKISGVMGAQFSSEQFQVIIGNTVSDVFEEVSNLLGGEITNSDNDSGEKKGFVATLMDFISGIFTPIVPVLAGTGLLKGVLALLVILNVLSTESQTYILFYSLADGFFYFLPFMLAVSAAKKFKTSEYMALALAAVLMNPDFIAKALLGMFDPSVLPMKLFGLLPVPYVNYSNSVIPIILAVWLLSYVHKWVRSWMPKVIGLMGTPMVTLAIVMPVMMVVLGPIGNYAGNLIAFALTWLFSVAGPFAGLILGILFPLLIITGMHYSMLPVAMANFAANGYENTVGPVNACTNIAQAGAAFAVAFRSKNKEMNSLGVSTGLSALLGITEPAMYGVNIKLKKPFYCSLLGGGIGAGFAVMMNARSYGGGGMPGLLSLPGYITDKDPKNVIWMALALVISFVASFLLTFIVGFKEEDTEGVVADSKEKESLKLKKEKSKNENIKHRVFAPVSGMIVPLRSVSDATFAEELVGKGIAIKPSDNKIYSPISGTITLIPDTKHAFGIVGDDGIEILIHIGIDTVILEGKFFETYVEKGQHIEKGKLIGSADFESISKEGLDTVTIIVVTNTADYTEIMPVFEDGEIFKEEELLIVL